MSRRVFASALVAVLMPALMSAQSSSTVRLMIYGSGSVAFSSGGTCSTNCSMRVPRGADITFEATPKDGWVVSGWGGCLDHSADLKRCTRRIDGDWDVAVTFKDPSAPVYNFLSINKIGTGSLKSSPEGITCGASCYQAGAKFLKGTTVTITATPGSDGALPSFTGCMPTSSTATTCTVMMGEGRAMSVAFGNFLSVSKSGIGTGTVKSTPAGIDCGSKCGGYFSGGSTVKLSATAAGGSGVGSWGGCMPQRDDMATCTVSMNSGRAVTAEFTGPQFALTTNIVGRGGVMSARGETCLNATSCVWHYVGTLTATLTASPASPWTFGSWSGCPTVSGTKCTVPMSQAHTVTATFIAPSWPVTVQAGGTGSGTVTSSPAGIDCGTKCTASWIEGSTVTLTATPAAGSVLRAWITGPCGNTTEPVCRMTVSQAQTVIVQFNKK